MDISPARANDHTGTRGEAIFSVLLTRNDSVRGRLFAFPRYLGEKHEASDFLVELIAPGAPAYCFVQVRATRLGYTRGGRLRVRATADEINRLASYPAPTYLVGVDEAAERGYIVSTNRSVDRGLPSLSTRYALNGETLALLWRDVATYWQSRPQGAFESLLADHE